MTCLTNRHWTCGSIGALIPRSIDTLDPSEKSDSCHRDRRNASVTYL